MRCSTCHSYIPEGLPEPIVCPQCGKEAATNAPSTVKIEATPATPPPLPEPSAPPPLKPSLTPAADVGTTGGYAPYFTITTMLAFGRANDLLEPNEGSLSFGPEGFSLVWNEGKNWEKIPYRELGPLRLSGDSIRLLVRDIESTLVLYHPWLPRWIVGPRRERAKTFIELLDRVKSGLTSTEIAYYQRRLQ